ncbi:ABC transporter ATP-binding protein [Oxalobacteraceae bacterium A2-2]
MGTIAVNNLGKAYKQYPTRWSRLREWMLPFLGPRHQLKWILRDINFHIRPGEAVALIGVNGAGKSTLLKLITGTTQASTGNVHIEGSVAALLELGMGFHPDFSGRQNVYMAGQLMGLDAERISALMPEIEAFADIGEYIDQPVRVYSSGMQMRLAFSVATCVRPDILIVDEALAVGDVFFQQKCFDRIRSFTDSGTTLLFVSHSMGTVMNICDRALYIRQGVLAFDGAPRTAADRFQAELLGHEPAAHGAAAAAVPEAERLRHAPALAGSEGSITTDAADCIGVAFVQADGAPQATIIADQAVRLRIDYRVLRDLDDPHIGFKIRNRHGVVLFETNSYCMHERPGAARAGSLLSATFHFTMALAPEEYTVTVGLGNGGYDKDSFREVLNYLHEVSGFVVLPNSGAITWSGMANLAPRLVVDRLPAA